MIEAIPINHTVYFHFQLYNPKKHHITSHRITSHHIFPRLQIQDPTEYQESKEVRCRREQRWRGRGDACMACSSLKPLLANLTVDNLQIPTENTEPYR
jgi:hypothetical protein